jgi:hypothetical protein
MMRRLSKLGLILMVLLPACSASPRKTNARNEPVNANMNANDETSNDAGAPSDFDEVLAKELKKRKLSRESVCPSADPVARRVLAEYGAMFVAGDDVTPPPVCIFTNEGEVTSFQNSAGFATETISNDEIQLQHAAMKALLKAREEANEKGLDITPRNGAEAARRNYTDSLSLWKSRFLPALDYWTGKGKLTVEQAARLRSLPVAQQVAEVLELEKQGIFFSTDFSKSILYSVAAPGASQHIAMLAFDVDQFRNERVRAIMAKHGWFQTVLSDHPHFTFLGLKEKDLPKHGLKSVVVDGQKFWIPNIL